MPSGTSTMPSAVSSPLRGSSRSAPRRTSSSAVAGFATGMTIRAGRTGSVTMRRSAGAPNRSRRIPSIEQVRLEALERARLALDAVLGALGRQEAVLDDGAGDAPEIHRHEGHDM